MSAKVGKAVASPLVREGNKWLVRLRPSSENRKYRALLSIDGGGVRGIIPAVVLGGFEKAVKSVARDLFEEPLRGVDDKDLLVDLNDYFDMISGNSAGSILAAFLASGGGSEQLYGKEGFEELQPGSSEAAVAMTSLFVETAFTDRWYNKIERISKILMLFKSKHGKKGLATALTTVFGDIKLSDLKNNIYVPAYELTKARSVGFFRQALKESPRQGYIVPNEREPETETHISTLIDPRPRNPKHQGPFEPLCFDLPVRIVCQASSSAPVYFDPVVYKGKEKLGMELGLEEDSVCWADGGLVNNNPTINALSTMSEIYSSPDKTMLPKERMAVLSLGTRAKREPIHVGCGKGLKDWGLQLITALMDGNAQQSDNLVAGVLKGNLFENKKSEATAATYLRIDKLSSPEEEDYKYLGALDEVGHLAELKKIGNTLAAKNQDEMKRFIKDILMEDNN